MLLILLPAVLLAVLPIAAPVARAGAAAVTYACRPALPVFCRNIHVSCSGRTALPTSPFTVAITGASAAVTFGQAGDRTARRVPGPVTGTVENDGGGDLIVRLTPGRDWIRIQPDSRYSHRIYRKGQAAMSGGVCRAGGGEG